MARVNWVVYGRRWAMLLIFSACNATNAIIWISFAPITPSTEYFFGLGSRTPVNLLSVVFLLAYVPGSMLTSFVYHKHGARFGVVLGSTLNLASCLLRWGGAMVGVGGYPLLIVGQTIGAIAQPLFTNVPPKIAAIWFPIEERDVATVIAAVCNAIGIAIGNVIPAIFVSGELDKEIKSVDGMETLLLVELVLAGVLFLVALFFFENQPPSPPSRTQSLLGPSLADKVSASLAGDWDSEVMAWSPYRLTFGMMGQTSELSTAILFKQIWNEVMMCLRNRQFVLLLCGIGLGLGMFNSLATLVQQVTSPVGYSEDDASVFGAALIGCGLLGSGIAGWYLDATHRYNQVLKCATVLAVVGAAAFVALLRPGKLAAVTASFAVLGFAMMPILPTAFECGVECTYPAKEEISTGLLMTAGQLTGIPFIFGMQFLIDAQDQNQTGYIFTPVLGIVVGCMVFCSILLLLYNGPYLRLEAEGEDSKTNSEDVFLGGEGALVAAMDDESLMNRSLISA